MTKAQGCKLCAFCHPLFPNPSLGSNPGLLCDLEQVASLLCLGFLICKMGIMVVPA